MNFYYVEDELVSAPQPPDPLCQADVEYRIIGSEATFDRMAICREDIPLHGRQLRVWSDPAGGLGAFADRTTAGATIRTTSLSIAAHTLEPSPHRPWRMSANQSEFERHVLAILERRGKSLAQTRARIVAIQDQLESSGDHNKAIRRSQWRTALTGAGLVIAVVGLVAGLLIYAHFDARAERERDYAQLSGDVNLAVSELTAIVSRETAQLSATVNGDMTRLESALHDEVTLLDAHLAGRIRALSLSTDDGLGSVVEQLGRIEQRGEDLEVSYGAIRADIGDLTTRATAIIRLREAVQDIDEGEADEPSSESADTASIGPSEAKTSPAGSTRSDAFLPPNFTINRLPDDRVIVGLASSVTRFVLADGTPLSLRSRTLLKVISGQQPLGTDEQGRYVFDVNDVEIAIDASQTKMSKPADTR